MKVNKQKITDLKKTTVKNKRNNLQCMILQFYLAYYNLLAADLPKQHPTQVSICMLVYLFHLSFYLSVIRVRNIIYLNYKWAFFSVLVISATKKHNTFWRLTNTSSDNILTFIGRIIMLSIVDSNFSR